MPVEAMRFRPCNNQTKNTVNIKNNPKNILIKITSSLPQSKFASDHAGLVETTTI